MKIQVENELNKLFDFQGQTIEVSDQSVFTLKYLGLHEEEGKKINISEPITAAQSQSGHFLSFIMTVHPYQADPTLKNSHTTYRDRCYFTLLLSSVGCNIMEYESDPHTSYR